MEHTSLANPCYLGYYQYTFICGFGFPSNIQYMGQGDSKKNRWHDLDPGHFPEIAPKLHRG